MSNHDHSTSRSRDFAKGLLSRRNFNVGLLGAAALMTSGGLILSPSQAAAQTPKRGGSVRIAVSQQNNSDTYDSARYVNPSDYIRAASTYGYLVRIDEKGEAVPEVAESFESNQDATSWTFKIRKGIVFHDGSPLVMDDIVFSIMRHKDEAVASTAKQLASNIKSVRADGPETIIVDLVGADVDFPVMMGIYQFAIIKDGTTDFTNPNGTGPFMVKEFTPGLRAVCVRNPNYWREGRPYIDEFEIISIVDNGARVNALLSGDVDIIADVRGGNAIEQVENSPDHDLLVTPAGRYSAVQCAMDRPPSNNPDLGLALSYLIDRERMLQTVLRGYGAIANDHQFTPDNPYYDASIPQRQLDPDKAKYHLGRSGIGNSKIELTVSDGVSFSVDIGQLMQREAMRAGLNLELRREPSDSYWTAVAGNRPFCVTNFHPRPTINMLLNLTWKPGAPWNYSHYNNEKLVSLIDQARSTVDLPLRKEIYGQIQRIIHDSGAIVLPCFLSYVDGHSAKIRGLTPVPVGSLSGFNFTDKIWIDG